MLGTELIRAGMRLRFVVGPARSPLQADTLEAAAVAAMRIAKLRGWS